MIFVDNENTTNPALNLALEEYLLRSLATEEDIFLFYINEPSIIIGRHQNTLEEINLEYVRAHGIHVVRRLSGGGAVYHDLGNLNFSFITQNRPENIHNFRKFTEPVIRVLREMGVPAELGGRNDILADGRKISGNAQYIARDRMVSHGTLLFNTDLTVLSQALNVKPGKIVSKGIKSVQSRVANIAEFISSPTTALEFRAQLQRGLFAGSETIPRHTLTPTDWAGARALVADRYERWEWNFGRSPEFNVQRVQRFASGEIDARISVESGMIRGVRFFGDFFAQKDTAELETRLAGVRYTPEDVAAALDGTLAGDYFFGVSNAEFINFLFYA